MEVAGAQNLQTAACRRRKADPVGGRRRRGAGQWRASDERVADNDGRRAYGLRAPVIHSRGRVTEVVAGPAKLGTELALGAKSCDKQLGSSVFPKHLLTWLNYKTS